MAILRGCARCGGDILTADPKNVRCLQCGYRPPLPVEVLRRQRRRTTRRTLPDVVRLETLFRPESAPADAEDDGVEPSGADPDARCPRCEETDSIALEKLRPHFNTCYRCRLCGHIFSPAQFKAAS